MGMQVLLDVVHSHISKNADDGLAGGCVGFGGGLFRWARGVVCVRLLKRAMLNAAATTTIIITIITTTHTRRL